uniref:Tryptophan synthase alpha chain n=1 Tax=Antithamnion sp. TaxID=2767 RepID=TRPA_ANTSP|nr:RecName: Full=Tryptophan synthase alpha chain [Antithamnion sp.]CAA79757.1 tryptophane synthase [Antithamnion sp.]
MNIISESLRSHPNSCALIPFITAGYPDINTTIQALYELDSQGADIIELGIPYSDALADGSVIQHSSLIALQGGTYIDQVLHILEVVSTKLNTPIIILPYYNPILKRGIEKFIKQISLMGAKGLIVPDLPLEETDELIVICNDNQIELVLFVAPTSSMKRINSISKKSPGCIYLVSSTGVTGVRDDIDIKVMELSNYIKKVSNKFIMLGFGISTPEHIKKIMKWNIDGVVVGSAFVKKLSALKIDDRISSISSLCKSLKKATIL